MSLLSFFKKVPTQGAKRVAAAAVTDTESQLKKQKTASLSTSSSSSSSSPPSSPPAKNGSPSPNSSSNSSPAPNSSSSGGGMSPELKKKIEEKKKAAMLKRLDKERAEAGGATTFDNMEDMIHDANWVKALSPEFTKSYFKKLKTFLLAEEKAGKTIYPPKNQIFRAFNLTPFEDIRVVIIGQDPYHGPGQAEGLCFSVPKGQKIPSSLNNIFKEIAAEIPEFRKPSQGSLVNWATQGVLLLNTGLTVRKAEANSHNGKGWQQLTDVVIKTLSKQRKDLVFVLWGGHAQKKIKLIDKNKHCILKSPHPSGLSAHRGFFGNGHFVKINEELSKLGKEPINWQT